MAETWPLASRPVQPLPRASHEPSPRCHVVVGWRNERFGATAVRGAIRRRPADRERRRARAAKARQSALVTRTTPIVELSIANTHEQRMVEMRLTEAEALTRLAAHDHGVLCTTHPERGVDAVPVVYVTADRYVGVPIDRVKPKSSLRLQRERNLEADPRATLLVDHWDRDDWSQLWWVRIGLSWQGYGVADREGSLADELAQRFPQYRERPFERVLVLRIVAAFGWAGHA